MSGATFSSLNCRGSPFEYPPCVAKLGRFRNARPGRIWGNALRNHPPFRNTPEPTWLPLSENAADATEPFFVCSSGIMAFFLTRDNRTLADYPLIIQVFSWHSQEAEGY